MNPSTSSLPPLNRTWIERDGHGQASNSPSPGADWPERVLQFGEGNFLRAFVDWQIHRLNQRGHFRGRVVVIQPLPDGTVDRLNEQDGLYTVQLRGLQHGLPQVETELITCVSRGLNPYRDWPGFLELAANPHLRVIVSNTTEAGIAYERCARPVGTCPASFPAKVAAFLHERFRRFAGAMDKGFLVLPCELIGQNGDALKTCVLRHVEDWNLGSAFCHWLENANGFCNTLVDRIVPGYPHDEAPRICKDLGYADALLVTAEWFHLWVIQGPAIVRQELPLTEAGLNVVWADDIRPYRTLKVRILNGAHTLFSIPALLCGLRTVRESVEEPVLGTFLREALFQEILPTLDFAEQTRRDYAATVLERFRNPFIQHQLQSITLNSVAKFKVRVLPSLLAHLRSQGLPPRRLTFSLAALIDYFRRLERTPEGWQTRCGEQVVRVADDAAVLEFFQVRQGWHEHRRDDLCREFLGAAAFWESNLNELPGLASAVLKHLETIHARGALRALQELESL